MHYCTGLCYFGKPLIFTILITCSLLSNDFIPRCTNQSIYERFTSTALVCFDTS